MGEKGEGSGGEGGGKWGERGRELGMGYPPVHPLDNDQILIDRVSEERKPNFVNILGVLRRLETCS